MTGDDADAETDGADAVADGATDPGAVAVALRPFAVRLSRPLSTAAGRIDRREGLLVRVAVPAGATGGPDAGAVVGVGEATPLPGWTESLADCEAALSAARDRLDGTDPATLPRPTAPRRSGAPPDGDRGPGGDRSPVGHGRPDGSRHPALAALAGAPAARHGLTLALADLQARLAGRSLAAHLLGATDPGGSLDGGDAEDGDGDGRVGGDGTDDGDHATAFRSAVPDRLPVNAVVSDGPPGATADRAATAVADGVRTLKLKVGARPPAADRDRLRAVRDRVGAGIALRADANGAWDRRDADAFFADLSGGDVDVGTDGPGGDAAADRDAPDGDGAPGGDGTPGGRGTPGADGPGLEYVEQPLPAADLDGHAALRARHATPVALDESLAPTAAGDAGDPDTGDPGAVDPDADDPGAGDPAPDGPDPADPMARVDRALAAGAADALVLKPMALGGPDRVLRAARRAAAADVGAVVTTTVDAVVARAGAVHAAAAVHATGAAVAGRSGADPGTRRPGTHPGVRNSGADDAGVRGADAADRTTGGRAHGLATADRIAEDLAPDPAPVDGGSVQVPEGPGTGVDPGEVWR